MVQEKQTNESASHTNFESQRSMARKIKKTKQVADKIAKENPRNAPPCDSLEKFALILLAKAESLENA